MLDNKIVDRSFILGHTASQRVVSHASSSGYNSPNFRKPSVSCGTGHYVLFIFSENEERSVADVFWEIVCMLQPIERANPLIDDDNCPHDSYRKYLDLLQQYQTIPKEETLALLLEICKDPTKEYHDALDACLENVSPESIERLLSSAYEFASKFYMAMATLLCNPDKITSSNPAARSLKENPRLLLNFVKQFRQSLINELYKTQLQPILKNIKVLERGLDDVEKKLFKKENILTQEENEEEIICMRKGLDAFVEKIKKSISSCDCEVEKSSGFRFGSLEIPYNFLVLTGFNLCLFFCLFFKRDGVRISEKSLAHPFSEKISGDEFGALAVHLRMLQQRTPVSLPFESCTMAINKISPEIVEHPVYEELSFYGRNAIKEKLSEIKKGSTEKAISKAVKTIISTLDEILAFRKSIKEAMEKEKYWDKLNVNIQNKLVNLVSKKYHLWIRNPELFRVTSEDRQFNARLKLISGIAQSQSFSNFSSEEQSVYIEMLSDILNNSQPVVKAETFKNIITHPRFAKLLKATRGNFIEAKDARVLDLLNHLAFGMLDSAVVKEISLVLKNYPSKAHNFIDPLIDLFNQKSYSLILGNLDLQKLIIKMIIEHTLEFELHDAVYAEVSKPGFKNFSLAEQEKHIKNIICSDSSCELWPQLKNRMKILLKNTKSQGAFDRESEMLIASEIKAIPPLQQTARAPNVLILEPKSLVSHQALGLRMVNFLVPEETLYAATLFDIGIDIDAIISSLPTIPHVDENASISDVGMMLADTGIEVVRKLMIFQRSLIQATINLKKTPDPLLIGASWALDSNPLGAVEELINQYRKQLQENCLPTPTQDETNILRAEASELILKKIPQDSDFQVTLNGLRDAYNEANEANIQFFWAVGNSGKAVSSTGANPEISANFAVLEMPHVLVVGQSETSNQTMNSFGAEATATALLSGSSLSNYYLLGMAWRILNDFDLTLEETEQIILKVAQANHVTPKKLFDAAEKFIAQRDGG